MTPSRAHPPGRAAKRGKAAIEHRRSRACRLPCAAESAGAGHDVGCGSGENPRRQFAWTDSYRSSRKRDETSLDQNGANLGLKERRLPRVRRRREPDVRARPKRPKDTNMVAGIRCLREADEPLAQG